MCVGESLAQREQGVTEELVAHADEDCPAGRFRRRACRRVVIAYEPVWAIGTGRTATGEQAQRGVRGHPRSGGANCTARPRPTATTVQYGGSMNAANAAELLEQPDVDGGLIGGASLKADAFGAIVAAASK